MRNTIAIVTLIAGFGVVNLTLPAMAVQPTTFPRETGQTSTTNKTSTDFIVVDNGSAKNGRGGLALKRTFKKGLGSLKKDGTKGISYPTLLRQKNTR